MIPGSAPTKKWFSRNATLPLKGKTRGVEWCKNKWMKQRLPSPFLTIIWLMIALSFVTASGAVEATKPARKPQPPVDPGKPQIFELEPRGIQRGVPARIKIVGTNLIGLSELKILNPKMAGELLEEPPATTNEVWIALTAPTNLARGSYEISVKNTNAESGPLKVFVDDLPQAYESGSKSPKGATPLLHWPVSFWGVLNPAGDSDEVEFDAQSGVSLVLEIAAKSLGSKAETMLALFDHNGALLASNNGLDGGDPLLNFKIPATGRYRVRIADRTDAGSKEHFYRLSIGTFPVVVGCFPLGLPLNHESTVELIGFNLPHESRLNLKPATLGEMDLPVDAEKFRLRHPIKIIVTEGPELMEIEPNNLPSQAMKIPVPAVVNGRIWNTDSQSKARSSGSNPKSEAPELDVDLFRFEAKAGQALVIETDAARRGSPMDTKIEILHQDGRPVERVLLQAVRDSHVTFRGIDSVTDDLRVENWQEMELNQYLYMQGEVSKIYRMPQGPDSGFQFYNNQGKRLDYFGTSPVAHALDEPAYIVEAHPPGTRLLPNGLPAFTIYYANDDDPDRKLGTDSRLLFNPPADGSYLVRVTDTRSHSGDRFAYRLIVREARPDFKVTFEGENPTINAGSGREFLVRAERFDGFDDDIRVDFSGLPAGFAISTPVTIQAGHLHARGTLNAAIDALQSAGTNLPPIKVTATAILNGHSVTKEVNSPGKIKLAEKPKLFVSLEPYDERETNYVDRAIADKPLEITIAPGQSVPAWLKIKRNGHDDLVTFSVSGLPHGVIVDNIGLNGVLIPKDQNERQIFLTAAKWVPDVDRLCFAQANQADNQTSLPVMLHVRKDHGEAASNAASQNRPPGSH
jgi:hypothetical protein